MIDKKFEMLTGISWEEAATRSNELFVEADRLDEQAYLLLVSDKVGSSSWEAFASAKRAAVRKRCEAHQEWFRITRILNSIDPNSGRTARKTLH